MGQKIKKVGFNRIVPKAVNFASLKYKIEEDKGNFKPMDSIGSDDFGDEGKQFEGIEESLQFEELVVQMLYNLEVDEKCIFLFQLLREMGYQIDHISFAKTLHISRSKYMDMLQSIRIKTFLMVKSQGVEHNSQTNHTQVG